MFNERGEFPPLKKKKMRKPNYNIIKDNYDKHDIYEGESIEQEMQRATTMKQPIDNGAPIIFTDRADGVLAQYNIRTDRWEIAQDAMDVISKTETAKRMEYLNTRTEEKNTETNLTA